MSNQLSAQFRLKLLRVARQSLENFLENGNLIQFPTEIPELLEKRAVFVTLGIETTEIFVDASVSPNRATL